jgi:plastocyanin
MIRRAAALALTAVALATAPVGAIENVTIFSQAGGFQPATVKATLGEVVDWDNEDDIDHTTSQRRPLALWSRRMDPDESFEFAMLRAGTFPYLCMIHPDMTGRVRVPMTAAPDNVAVGGQVVLRVAHQTAQSGFRYKIVRRRPGGTWKVWRTITSKTTSWKPKANAAGEWEFRAKTIRISNGGTSAWSPAIDLHVES